MQNRPMMDLSRVFAGQTVGLIGEILPAAEITRRIVTEAEDVLRRMTKVLT